MDLQAIRQTPSNIPFILLVCRPLNRSKSGLHRAYEPAVRLAWPIAATLHPVSGAFQWTPNPSQFEQTHRFSIRVEDNGNPPFSETRSVTVTVRSLRIVNLAFPNGPLAYLNEREILWYSVPGQSYRLEFTDRAENGVWINYAPVQATAPVSSAMDGSILPLPQRLYRVRWLP